MKKILLFVIAISLFHFECTEANKTSLPFQDDPIKKAFTKNRVASYISYELDSGRMRKIDSAILDLRGNALKIKNIGCCSSEREMKYDSLNRLISTIEKSDITNFVKLKYESPTKGRLICIEYLSDFESDSGKMVFQTITEFDLKSNRPMIRTEIHLTNQDTSKFRYLYAQGKLMKEIRLPEKDSVYVKYDYIMDRLIRKKSVWVVDSYYVTEEEFFSPITGLRDSVHSFDGEFLAKTYYKYYFREN